MQNNNAQMLQSILEALMTVSTKGNDTITMANCLQALQQTVQQVAELENKLAAAAQQTGKDTPQFVTEE